ncbi:MAG: zinc-ribbon domain-containing protein [Hyphomicrobium sp.]|uniref:S41 family peptidase n=1 Tax=Hyphomicrobium sp. TaxID=82 RepID=UPI0013257ACA|nr:S41 family peptidase [Hyphomicrobium sp.]KAB2941747.1 MAG: hypothetical protein F9K20_08335 [Hyphomicrobium sp.]MBZ0210028.1 zinc-ribbon domain-containing protein [Hyphomicrobium sp.]
MAICPTCGASVAAGDRFCGACGHGLADLGNAASVLEQRQGSKRNLPIVGLVVLGALVLGVGIYQAIQHNFIEPPSYRSMPTPPTSPVPEPSKGWAVTWRAEGTIAYIRLRAFEAQTHAGLVSAIEALKQKIGPDLGGYVLDLRDNAATLPEQAVDAADEFLDRGTILTARNSGADDTKRAQATPGDITEGKRIVVLINGATALAANVVAGALQDHRRASIVGTRSHSNPSLKNGASEYYSPSNRALSLGIEPDVVVEQGRGDKSTGRTQSSSSSSVPENPVEDTQLQYSLDFLRKPR